MRASLVIGLMLALAAHAPASEFTVSVEGNAVRAELPDGNTLWRVDLPGDGGRHITVLEDGLIRVSDGTLIDRCGRIVGRDIAAPAAPLLGDLGRAPNWDPLAEIMPPPAQSDAHHPPFFDGAGNAWVFITHIESGDYSLLARTSNGQDGTWQPVVTVSDTTNYVAGPETTIDIDDNIVTAFRDISGGYKLYTKRYEPNTGWGTLQQVYSSSNFFQAIEIGADDQGNFVVVFDRNVSNSPRAWSIAYNAQTGTWGSAAQVSPSGLRVSLPTIIRNDTGSNMYLVYLVTTSGSRGLYAHKWQADTLTWGPAETLPGTESAAYSGAGPVSRFPGVVDAWGNATVFWGDADVFPYASRTENGVWQSATPLLAQDVVDIENFAGAAVSPSGKVYGVCSRFESGQSRFVAFPYVMGDGWQEAQLPFLFPTNFGTRVRVAFYQGERAVATMLGVQDTGRQITSMLHTGAAWIDEVVDIPGQQDAFYADLTNDRGEVLLVYEGEVSGQNQGIKATWLRHPHLGDLNCDGLVDFDDINPFVQAIGGYDAYYAAFPDCYWLNGDIDGNGVVDFDDINPFVALLSGD